jgi:hypothetical protein
MKSFKKFVIEKKDSIKDNDIEGIDIEEVPENQLEEIKSKEIDLKRHKISIKTIFDKDENNYRLEVKSIMDPNIKGYVEFKEEDDVNSAFENLTNINNIALFLDRNSKEYTTAYNWAKIIKDELSYQNLGSEADVEDRITSVNIKPQIAIDNIAAAASEIETMEAEAEAEDEFSNNSKSDQEKSED